MRFVKVFFAVLVIISVFQSCQKDADIDHSLEFYREVFSWQRGSYWIMSDSSTGQVDSFFVKENREERNTYSDDSYSTVNVTIAEVDLSTNEEICIWQLRSKGLRGESMLKISPAGNDTSIIFPDFFQYILGQRLSDMAYSGVEYSKVYSNASNFSVTEANASLQLAVSGSRGMLYARAISSHYTHTWNLVRSHTLQK